MQIAGKRFFAAIGLMLVGAMIGPILFAGLGAFLTASKTGDSEASSSAAAKLVQVYRQRLPQHFAFTTIAQPPNGEECGYDPDKLFPAHFKDLSSTFRNRDFKPYAGYWLLNRWRLQSRDEEWYGRISQAISSDMSIFEISFLTSCIESTVLEPLCTQKVAVYGDRVPRFYKGWQWGDHGFEDDVVCGYIDGVAARKNIPLATSQKRHIN